MNALVQEIGEAVLATPTAPNAPAETPAAFIEQTLSKPGQVTLSNDAMDALVSPRVPADVYAWLEQVQAEQAKEFNDYGAFAAALRRAIGAELLAPYRAAVMQAAEVRYLRLTLDGQSQQFELGQGEVTLAHQTDDALVVGRKLMGRPSYRYFRGWLKELRVWSQVRTAEQLALGSVRAVGTREPGLVGCWRFDQITDGQARDLSSLGNHLFLGGIIADYAPKRVATDYYLPPLPVAVAGKALAFDGQNTLVEVQDAQNRGLGAYDRMTLALWFNAADAMAAGREQMLYAQGDAEDGLAIYLHEGVLTVAAWANTFEGDNLQTVRLKTAAGQIASGKWRHVAVSKDEEPSADAVAQKLVRYTAYLDGAPFGDPAAAPFRLCPVGPAWLGGLASDAVVWTEALGVHANAPDGQAGNAGNHHFTGMLADLRVWRTAKPASELVIERFVAPVEPDPDLIHYLPLTEGSSPVLEERSGQGASAIFHARNMVLGAQAVPAELDEVHAHYGDPAALSWTNYVTTGRLRIGAADSAAGLTFFSRYPEQIDRYYALRRDKDQPAFALVSHPPAAPALRGQTNSQVTPQANEWHRFRIEASVEADRTRIRAKVWPESAAEPAAFQIDAYDASSLRLTAGTVGLWTAGDGQPPIAVGDRPAFDQIEVHPLTAGPALLVADFDRLPAGQAPAHWQQTGTRSRYPGRNDLFRTITRDGNTTYGADLPEAGNISLLTKRGAQKWTNYAVRGQVLVTDQGDGGVGVIFLANGSDQYYLLSRTKDSPSFALRAWPAGLQTLAGKLDTGVVPAANTAYSFKIRTEITANETRILAKVWQTEDDEPDSYQVEAVDASEIRLRAGTVGVWSSGPGLKCIDSLIVSTIERKGGQPRYAVLHSESFRTYRRGRKPANWQDKGAVEHFQPLSSAFIGGEAQTGVPRWQAVQDYPVLLRPLNRKALRFDGKLAYAAAEAVSGLDGTPFTVEAWIKPARAAAGPILSQRAQPGAALSLQLGLDAQGRLALSHARSKDAQETLAAATPLNTAGWSHVAVVVEGSGVQFYVNGRPDGSATAAEPIALRLGGSGLELGRGLDLVAGAPAMQRFDGEIRELRVWRGARSAEQIAGGRFQQPELSDELIGYWPLDEDTGATTADQSRPNDNALRLGGIESARRPTLHDPAPVFAMLALADPTQDAGLFDPAALKLDGVDDFVEIALTPAVAAPAATWEAWVRPTSFGAATTLWEQDDQRIRLGWQGNRLAVTIAGNDPATQTFDFGFDPDAWAHVAVVYDSAGQRATLFVNGVRAAEQRAYTASAALDLASARVGLDQLGQAGLRGLVKELRLWSRARSEAEINALLFRRLTGAEPNLLVYRPFNEQASLEHAPAWVSPDLLADSLGQGFFRPQRLAVTFDSQDGRSAGLVGWSGATTPASAAPCQRRTVEVWFRADDVRISRRKQVIYHEGDDRQGLAIYLFDGRLYYGGYSRLADPQDWAHWTGTWLNSDRVRSGKWHHAAIVLDGRDERRDGSFQAYLDGKLVDDGVGAQLTRSSGGIALGRAGGTILFHDGTAGGAPAPAPLPAPPATPPTGPTPERPLTPQVLDKTSIPLGKPQQPFPFPSQAFTVECWINPNVSRYQGSPISYAVSEDNDNAFVLYLYNHRELTVVINEQRISASGVVSLDPNRWQHVAVTWRASDGQIYVYKDGQEVYRGKVSAGKPVDSGGSLIFGQEQDRPGGELDPYEAYDGQLSEVRIWDHVRTTEQIRAGMHRPMPASETGLAARWPADAVGSSSQTPASSAGAAGPGSKASAGAAAAGQDATGMAQPADAALFGGQILDLRIWSTARTQRQLDVYRYRQLRAADANDSLDLWWQFEAVVHGQVPDLAGKGHTGTLTPPARVQPMGAAPAPARPRSRLDEEGLGRLANLKRLMERFRLPMDRLTALWHEIRHTGREDGRTLWDDTFNPTGSAWQPWPFHIDQPLRWDVSGATGQEQSRQIRSRLMGALRISHDNLNLLVVALSGQGETFIELDGPYLTNLYRLARLPGLLGLSVAEFERLLGLMQLPRVASLDALMAVSERAEWMRRTGIDVFELDFLAHDRASARVAFPYSDASIRDLADSLRRQSGELLARPNTFVTSEVGELASAGLFRLMQPDNLGIVDSRGAVRPDYEPPAEFEELVYLARGRRRGGRGQARAQPDPGRLRPADPGPA
ncbi:MAG: LamG-like jellyroll fold domain-containing protein [Anaerolineae bacterium]